VVWGFVTTEAVGTPGAGGALSGSEAADEDSGAPIVVEGPETTSAVPAPLFAVPPSVAGELSHQDQNPIITNAAMTVSVNAFMQKPQIELLLPGQVMNPE
jgi:hypothetical protein